MKKILKYFILTVFLFQISATAFSGSSQVTVAKYVSLCLYNFAKLIQWPDDASNDKFIIGIVGEKEIFEQLVVLTKNKMVGTKTFEIKYYESSAQISGNHNILYVTGFKNQTIQLVSDKYKNSTLIVTKNIRALEFGSDINFFLENDKLVFEINKTEMTKRSMFISSSLTKLASKVI